MARGDPILCQDPGDVLQFANQTRSQALVALFDEGLTIKDLHVVEAGQESRGISAQPGDTFAVANTDGRLLYEHAMPVKHPHSDTAQRALRLMNLHTELESSMKLMDLLAGKAGDLLEDLLYVENQLIRSNEEALRHIKQERDLDLISASEDELFLDGDDLGDDGAVMVAAEAWELILELNCEARALTDHPACDLAYLKYSNVRATTEPGVDVLLANATQKGLDEALRNHSLPDAIRSLKIPPFVELNLQETASE